METERERAIENVARELGLFESQSEIEACITTFKDKAITNKAVCAAVDREEKLLKIGRLADNCACYTCADIRAILEGK